MNHSTVCHAPLSNVVHKWKNKYIRKESKDPAFLPSSQFQVTLGFHLSGSLKPHQKKAPITPVSEDRTSPRGPDSLSLFFFNFTPRIYRDKVFIHTWD